MNAVVKSTAVFATLSGLFWGGWMVGSQTPQGQEALAKAYEALGRRDLALAHLQHAVQSEPEFIKGWVEIQDEGSQLVAKTEPAGTEIDTSSSAR